MASTTAIDMGRVRTQLDRRALSCFHQRCIFDRKIYSRKTGTKYLLWFVAQTGVLHNTIAERVDADPFSSGYLDKAYNMTNHMMVVSRYLEFLHTRLFVLDALTVEGWGMLQSLKFFVYL